MAEVISSPVPVILFIDEAHTLIGAGNQQGGLDISNLLKPALARGELKTIAATTWSEYKKYFEKDAALSRRFQLVKVSEPNAAEATIILRGLSAVYEQSHGVLIDDDALQAAATLSERYLSGRQLPDKAIDVLDTACARVAINLSSPPKQISALTTLSHQQEAEIRQLERELRIGLRTATSRMTEVLVQYDETLTALDELLQEPLDALAITPVDTPLVYERLKALKPLPIVTLHTDIHCLDSKLAFIGCDYINSGRLCGDVAMLALPQGGSVGIVTGSFHILGHNQRIMGFREAVATNPNIRVLELAENKDDNDLSYQVTKTLLTTHHPDLLYFCAAGTEGGMRAVTEADYGCKVVVVDRRPQG